MKIFKKLFQIFMFLLFCSISANAADDLTTQQITIKLNEAGTLPNKIGDTKKFRITNLKIIGEINGTDLKMIREMAGRDSIGKVAEGNLCSLDLSEAKIVSGGNYYYCYTGRNIRYYTSNNILGSYAFSGCSGLTNLVIPSSVTKIGSSAFDFCSGLTDIVIPSSVTEIDDKAFLGCSGLTNIVIPSSVTKIGDKAFDFCSGLTNIVIPSSVTKIGDYAFSGCI